MTSRPLADTEAYREAKAALAHELSEEVLSWSFSRTMDVLRREIRQNAPKDKTRFFARHHIGLKGEKFNELIQWLKHPSTMCVEEVTLVLRALQKLQPKQVVLLPPVQEPVQEVGPTPNTNDAVVKHNVVAHFVTMFNSGNLLLDAHDIQPKDVFDGSRISIQLAMQQLCKRFGIAATFSDTSAQFNEPVTRGDLVSIGLRKRRGK